MFLMIGGASALNTGILLKASGGSFEMFYLKGNLDTRLVKGIHGAAGQTKALLVIEG
jgi:hypothetical protein